MSKNNWCCNFIVRQLRNNSHLQSEEHQKSSPLRYQRESMSNTSSLKPFIKRGYCPYNWHLTRNEYPLSLNGWMVRVCLNSNNIMGANVQNLTGHYSAVNWNRCVSHCGAAKELLLCLFVYQLLSQQSRCVSRRNQILQPNLPRWQARKTRRGEKSTRSSKMERRIRNNQKILIRTPSPPQTYLFVENSSTQLGSLWTFASSKRRTSHTRLISPSQSLARSETPPLCPLLVAELAWSRWDRDMHTTNMTVTTRTNPSVPGPN